MTKGKRDLSNLELRMGTFQVRPEWYEEYWLKPDDAPSAGKRRLRWSTAMYAALAAAVLSVIATFIGA